MSPSMGLARIWLGSEPERGAHSSIVGVVVADALGVHVPADAMCNLVNLDDYRADESWPRGEWCEWSELGVPSLIPWHRVDCIDWYVETGESVESLTSRPGIPA